jgi:hypothetical protein
MTAERDRCDPGSAERKLKNRIRSVCRIACRIDTARVEQDVMQPDLQVQIRKAQVDIAAQKRIIERAGTNQVVIAAATSQLRDLELRLATMEEQVTRATRK